MLAILGLILYIAFVWAGLNFGVVKLSACLRKEYIHDSNVWMIISLTIVFSGILSILVPFFRRWF